MSTREVEEWLDRLFIAAEGAGLRREDRRKAIEVAAILEEVRLAARQISPATELTLVDAAAGKAYVGLLAAKLIFEPAERKAAIITIEQDERRVEVSRRAAERLETSIPIDCRAGDVGSAAVWPQRPAIVTALHACGPAADAIIERAIAVQARWLLLVPCCTSASVHAAERAEARGRQLGVPRHAPVRRRFIQAMVDAERTCVLEAAGYQTEVVEFVAATVTPHNLLWRARRVCEPVRMAAAQRSLDLFLESE